jgi:hypothetical protein
VSTWCRASARGFADTRVVLHQALAPIRAVLRARVRELERPGEFGEGQRRAVRVQEPEVLIRVTRCTSSLWCRRRAAPAPTTTTPMIAIPLERPGRYD